MSIPQRIASYSTSLETTVRANEFLQIARALCVSRNEPEAQRFLARVPASDRARQALTERAAVAVGTTTDSTWASPLSQYEQLSDSFAESLRSSAFDKILADNSFLRAPAMARLAVITASAAGYIPGEGAPKPASVLAMTNVELQMAKCSAYVIISAELMRAGGAGALALLGRELRAALALVTDEYFLGRLTTGLSAIPSAGSSSLAVRNDVRFLLDAVSLDANSRPYFIAPAQVAKRLSSLGDSSGGRMFAGLTPVGGLLDGVPLLTSDAATANTLLLVDAAQVAVAAGVIELDRSDAATLVLDSAPSSPPTVSDNYQSLWQLNQSALRAERFLSAQRMRSTAAASVSGITGLGSSP